METSSNIPNTGPPKSTQQKENQADRAKNKNNKNNNNNNKKNIDSPTHLAICNLASFLTNSLANYPCPKNSIEIAVPMLFQTHPTNSTMQENPNREREIGEKNRKKEKPS